jgi:L-seryl-tRNA(Ser) seleniumtransferase
VDVLLASPPFLALQQRYPRERVAAELRAIQAGARRSIADGRDPGDVGSTDRWAGEVGERLEAGDVPSLRRVVNATGVVLHTNLGRAPLAAAAVEAMTAAAEGYSNLEYDLGSGERGSRYQHCSSLLAELTGADSALVVNNAAAALVLALSTLARGREVIVSRGELVEIGGGFRIPEILDRSGAALVEVGSTNRTRAEDYAHALASRHVSAILKVHRSNFRMTGFTEEASVAELATLARDAGVPLLHDLGSGLLMDPATLGLPQEPRAVESLAAGADAVIFSGDKLLGGPQAGILVGRADLIAACTSNPLCRALRVDKVTLAGLEATLRLYRDPARALAEVPVLRMLVEPEAAVRERAELVARRVASKGMADARVDPSEGAVGGGTYPGVTIPSWAVTLSSPNGAAGFAAELRRGDPPVIARVEEGRVVLDARTIDADEVDTVVRRIVETAGRVAPA